MKQDDIFILSKGHAVLTLYCILNDKGIISDKKLFDYPDKLGGHIQYKPKNKMYAGTGSLGHGIAIALGYALADRDRDVYCLCGDGEMQEGSSYEAMCLKDKLKLKNLYILVDNNCLSGYQSVSDKSYVNGHDFGEIHNGIGWAYYFKTIKGRGVRRFEHKMGSHYWNLEKGDI